MPRDVRIAERIYRLLLHAFPPAFRRRLGNDMAEAFRDGCHAARARSGRTGLARHVVAASGELVVQGARERAAARHLPHPRSPRKKNMIDRFATDVRYALRALRRSPAFTFVAVLTLAVGIGATTAIFSVVNGVLLRPLPYSDPEELITLSTSFRGRGGISLSEPEFVDLETLTDSFAGVGAIDYEMFTLGGAETPERIRVVELSAQVLPTLGVEPAIGRAFSAEDDRPEGERVVLLSHGLWQQGFGGDDAVIGRSIELEGIEHTVIGVMPEGFSFPLQEVRAWTPLRLDRDDLWERNNHYLDAVARLAEGVTLETARAELAVLSAQVGEQYPDIYPDGDFSFEAAGMLDEMVGDSRAPLLLLLAAVGFVLLVACTNVANLLLARSEARRREVAVRSALGGGRGVIVAQLLTESALLGLAGGILGLALAGIGTRLLLGMSPDALPRAENVAIDGGVLLFTLLVSLATSALFGLAPALHAAAGNVQGMLQEGGRSQAGSRRAGRSRAALVVAEVALAALLLVGGTLLLRSFVNLRNVDPGFHYDNVLTAQLALPAAEYDEPVEVVRYYDRVLESVATIPGVESVGAVARLPLARGVNNWSLQVEDAIVEDVADAPTAQIQQATPGYFDVMGLRLLQGRFFEDTDVAGAPGVAIVSEGFARLHWPGESAVGKRIKVFLEDWPWLEVVGVVADVKQLGLASEPDPKVYFAFAQAFETAYVSPANMHVVMRTATDPGAIVPQVRERVWAVDDSVPFGLVAPMREVLASSLAAERFVVTLLTTFSLVALFLAAVGIAGVIAYSVSERTREIGIRVALGAVRSDVTRLVVAPALALTAVGVALGVSASAALSGVLEGMLFQVAGVDPLTYVAVAALFLLFALAACWVPARRAARVDPLVSLRSE